MRRILIVATLVWLGVTSQAGAAGLLGVGARWSGLYAGINAGYAWGEARGSVVAGPFALNATSPASGWLAGAQVGFDWQLSGLVVGAVADIQASTQSTQTALCAAAVCGYALTGTNSMPWFATLRGRAGFALDRFLVYGTAGLAIAEYRSDLTSQVGGAIAVVPLYSDRRTGFVLGAGIELAILGGWTARAEYLFIDSGTMTESAAVPFAGTVTASGRVTSNILRTGLSYRFF